jgi:peptide/nickel transport system permease protein
MPGYLLRRLAASLLLLLLVLTATFVLLHLAPGDPLAVVDGLPIPKAEREHLIRAYGLDRPLAEQYVRWLGAVVLHGDWGLSYSQQRPVSTVIGEALPATLLLAGAALLVEYGLGVSLGVAAARRSGSAVDRAIRAGSLLLYSQPPFWLGILAILLFAYRLRWLPASHMHSIGAGGLGAAARLADLGRHLVLPALTIGLGTAGGAARFVRASLLDVLGRDHIRAARAKGLSERRVVWVHALRGALPPLIQLLGISVPNLLSGALIIEVVFAWPGLGRITWEAILSRDYPVVVATTALSAVLVIAANLVADLLHAAADPTLRRESGA